MKLGPLPISRVKALTKPFYEFLTIRYEHFSQVGKRYAVTGELATPSIYRLTATYG